MQTLREFLVFSDPLLFVPSSPSMPPSISSNSILFRFSSISPNSSFRPPHLSSSPSSSIHLACSSLQHSSAPVSWRLHGQPLSSSTSFLRQSCAPFPGAIGDHGTIRQYHLLWHIKCVNHCSKPISPHVSSIGAITIPRRLEGDNNNNSSNNNTSNSQLDLEQTTLFQMIVSYLPLELGPSIFSMPLTRLSTSISMMLLPASPASSTHVTTIIIPSLTPSLIAIRKPALTSSIPHQMILHQTILHSNTIFLTLSTLLMYSTTPQ